MSIWQVSVCKSTVWSSLVGDMFQKKIDELISGMLNVFRITDGILIVRI